MVCRFDLSGDRSAAIVRLSGRLDLLTAADVKHRIQRLVAEGWTRLVVDLSAVAFIDSSGLGALIHGLKVARSAGGDIRIAQASEQVHRVLQACMLDRILKPYPTVEEALADYTAAA